MKLKVIGLVSTISLLVYGSSIAGPKQFGGEISFSDTTAQVKVFQAKKHRGMDTQIGANLFYTTTSDKMGYVYTSVMRPHVRGFYPLGIGVVPKLAYITHGNKGKNESGVSLMLGAKGSLSFNMGLPVVFSAIFAYGPEIFSSGDVKGVKSLEVRGGMEVAPNVSLFVEYGYTKVDFTKAGNEYTLDDTARVGIGLAF